MHRKPSPASMRAAAAILSSDNPAIRVSANGPAVRQMAEIIERETSISTLQQATKTLIDNADGLIAAIDGTTGQVEPEVAALIAGEAVEATFAGFAVHGTRIAGSGWDGKGICKRMNRYRLQRSIPRPRVRAIGFRFGCFSPSSHFIIRTNAGLSGSGGRGGIGTLISTFHPSSIVISPIFSPGFLPVTVSA